LAALLGVRKHCSAKQAREEVREGVRLLTKGKGAASHLFTFYMYLLTRLVKRKKREEERNTLQGALALSTRLGLFFSPPSAAAPQPLGCFALSSTR